MTTELPAPHVLDEHRVDAIWMDAAARIGFFVRRTTDAYASADGTGTILVGERETLDNDDCLAQLVFHELCHALVEGPSALRLPDWGLDNTTSRDVTREHACLRLQAHLADRHALRPIMAPTTVYRPYYDVIPAIALAGDQPACAAARKGARFAQSSGWLSVLDGALASTATLLRLEGRWAAAGKHPLGDAAGPDGQSCGGCVWRYDGPDGARCRQDEATGPRIDPSYPACLRWEAAPDCQGCGACCRGGFDAVTVAVRDAVTWRQPALLERHGPRFRLRREGDHCAALKSGQTQGRYSCAIYDDRPQACREVLAGGARCLAARRRVGLSA